MSDAIEESIKKSYDRVRDQFLALYDYAEELEKKKEQLERENAELREALKLAIHVRGTSDDTPEILGIMEKALRDCYSVLIESGQLEVNPPRSLVDFFKPQRDTNNS